METQDKRQCSRCPLVPRGRCSGCQIGQELACIQICRCRCAQIGQSPLNTCSHTDQLSTGLLAPGRSAFFFRAHQEPPPSQYSATATVCRSIHSPPRARHRRGEPAACRTVALHTETLQQNHLRKRFPQRHLRERSRRAGTGEGRGDRVAGRCKPAQPAWELPGPGLGKDLRVSR